MVVDVGSHVRALCKLMILKTSCLISPSLFLILHIANTHVMAETKPVDERNVSADHDMRKIELLMPAKCQTMAK